MFTLKDFKNTFKDCPEKSLNSLLALASEVSLKKNEIIAKTGEICKNAYIVKQGIIRSFHTDDKGKEYTQSLFTAGKASGSLGSLISGQASRLTYECLTDCVVYKFNFKDFKELAKKDSNILKLYSQILENIQVTQLTSKDGGFIVRAWVMIWAFIRIHIQNLEL